MKKYLFLALLAPFFLLACSANAQHKDLSTAAFEQGILQENIQLLDVRTKGEYEDGHIKDARLADWTESQEFDQQVEKLDKTRPVYTYCHSGRRSRAAAAQLKRKGFKEVYNLNGGIKAWKAADKPVE